jgi:hypothetical protein
MIIGLAVVSFAFLAGVVVFVRVGSRTYQAPVPGIVMTMEPDEDGVLQYVTRGVAPADPGQALALDADLTQPWDPSVVEWVQGTDRRPTEPVSGSWPELRRGA